MSHLPPASARPILELLKREGPASIRELARRLKLTYEAVRLQVGELARGGWIARTAPAAAAGAGRRAQRYGLTAAGDHLFPKHYDALSGELIGTVLEQDGRTALVGLLERMTQVRVERWRARLETLPLKQRLAALRGLYEEDDAYMRVHWRGGTPRLVEHNCPFLNVARAHPAICSVSVNTLSRVLGFQVVREKRFQSGDGCCVFRVCLDRPVRSAAAFELEDPAPA